MAMRQDAEAAREVSSLVRRTEALLHEVAAAQKELFALAVRPGSLPSRLAGLFAGPPRVLRGVDPPAQIAPGIRINFAAPARLDIIVAAKPLSAERAGAYPNTAELRLTGGGAWLALEIALDWPDLGTGSHYQLSIHGLPSRSVDCRAAVRLVRHDGSLLDHPVVTANLSPTDRFFSLSGEVDMGVLDGVDLEQKPRLVLLFETKELRLLLFQIVASFD